MKKTYSIILVTFVCVVVIMAVRGFKYPPSRKAENLQTKPPATAYTFPAEFDRQQAIWLQWPPEIYNTDRPVYPVTLTIMKALEPYIRVNLMVRSQEEINQVKDLLKSNGYTGNKVHYYVVNHMSIWTRDVGPIFIKDPQNKLQVVDFGFNNYSRGGDPNYLATESQVDRLAAEQLNLPVIKANLISEGGAIESNGRGTMLVTESVALSRNPKMSKEEIEKEYQRVLGVKKIIWLKKGLAEDDHITTGHINEIARFANPNTILLAQILPADRYINTITQESYRRMEENYQILRNATDQDGKPFHIIRIPMPPTLYGQVDETGKIPLLSYLNYAVTNGAVLMQTYWQPGRSDTLKTTENQVKNTLQKVFPGRRIIGINAENVNRWGGGIHCITQHMPE
ncbi:agmatine deiminase family protein [Desulforamulus aeronauticus]|uniref:Agmatine deiminase n=1 Tax=Desulforamulus aeronauticus DSM 10349 TaxID=1121421 RepID=A0A1M6WAN7_9FIRM|nr:agmatine deiminase family protein [Desulforamulus aeronauticus]SHK90566.1 agmatine deiminase [Desulforamulus aeronauticus DSM 10349]